MEIENSFNGYLKIGEDTFAYSYADRLLKLLPAESDRKQQFKITEKAATRNIELPEFLFGEDENAEIAFMRVSDFGRYFVSTKPLLWFSPPLIIKANGNAEGYYTKLTENWYKFHAISFSGGNINSIYNPQIVAARKNEAQYPNALRNEEEYTYTFKFSVDGINVDLIIGIEQNYNKAQNNAYILGEFNAYIRFVFEKAQDFSVIEKYYKIASSLVSFLTRQNNVSFNTTLYQRDKNGKLFCSALCSICDGFENYSKKDSHSVIPITAIIDCLPVLVDKLANNEYETLLALLPNDNRKKSIISINNVQDMCTALEVEYERKKITREKDAFIKILKDRIKATINDFLTEYPSADIYKDSTISSAFQYLDYTLKNKIWTLYQENKIPVDIVSKKLSMPALTIEKIGDFVKLRNSKTHDGQFNWGDNAEIYPVLLALVYSTVLKQIGLTEKEIEKIAFQIF